MPEIPPYLINSKIKKIRFDVGKDWINNSTLNSLRFDNLEHSKLVYESYFSFRKYVNYSLNCYNRINLPNYLYAYANIILKSNSLNIFDNYIDNYSLEFDHSGIGYRNSWLSLQLGKGTQNWGANHGIELSLSEMSESYNYSLLGLDLNKIRKQISAWLSRKRFY